MIYCMPMANPDRNYHPENFGNVWPKTEYPLGETVIRVNAPQRTILDLLLNGGARRSTAIAAVVDTYTSNNRELKNPESRTGNVLSDVDFMLSKAGMKIKKSRVPLENAHELKDGKPRRIQTEAFYTAVSINEIAPAPVAEKLDTETVLSPNQQAYREKDIKAARRRAAAQEAANLKRKIN